MVTWYTLGIQFSILFALGVMVRYLFYRSRYLLHMFQLNGYKLKEFWHWLKSHWENVVFLKEFIWLNLAILAVLWFRSSLTSTFQGLVVSLLTIGWFWPVSFYRQKQKKALVFTPRMKRLTAVYSMLFLPLPLLGIWSGGGLFSLEINPFVGLFACLLAILLTPVTVLLAGMLVSPVEASIQEGFKVDARRKVAALPGLTVIGITGSYGKTSTKFIIAELLKERFSVLATPGSYNTPMGICKVINNDLNAQHQVLVLEMGARYKGNIQELCEIAQPDISVVTNVGTAHLETFGSVEAIQATKSELIQYMKPGGKVILNGDDERVQQMASYAKEQVISVGLEHGQITATDIQYDASGCRFLVQTSQGDEAWFSVPLLGKHNVQNMLLGIGVGHAIGVRLETMAVAAKRIKPVEHRLELKPINGIIYIDDAFNSNPVGAANAVEILGQFKTGRRIIITPGMVELGDREEEENFAFGQRIGEAELDAVYLVGKKRSEPIYNGIASVGKSMDHVQVVDSLFEANDMVRPTLKSGDVVLYENDLPDSYNE